MSERPISVRALVNAYGKEAAAYFIQLIRTGIHGCRTITVAPDRPSAATDGKAESEPPSST